MPPHFAFPIVLLVVAILLVAFFALLMARAMLQPPRMNDGKAIHLLKRLSPGDLSLHFEPVQFDVRDVATDNRTTLRVAGWWIPNSTRSNRCVIFLHGFADAKVGSIAWAPTWAGLGFNILAIDCRAHGESEGRYCTAGFFERHDLAQVIDQLRLQRPKDTQEITLCGISYGAAIALATAAMRDDVSAVVIDSPFGDFERAAMTRLGASLPFVGLLASFFARKMSRANLAEVQPRTTLAKVPCPVMLIQSLQDREIDSLDFDALGDALCSRANGHDDHWIVETPHLLGLANDPMRYAERIEAFLERSV